MNAVLDHINKHSEKNHITMNRLSSKLADIFGVNYFAYQRVTEDGHWSIMGNNPDWLIYSAEKGFYLHDPSLVNPKYYQSGLCLPKTHQHEAFQETLIDHAIDNFDIDHALAVVKRAPGYCDYFFYAAPRKNQDTLKHYLNHQDTFVNAIPSYLHREFENEIKRLHQNPIDLHRLAGLDFNRETNLLKLPNRTNFFSSKNILSPRERDCLTLYRQGYTAKESAKILEISFRTVEDHFESIKNKLDCSTKRDLLKIES